MGKYKRLAGDTLLFAIGSFGSRAILFLLVPLYTNYLSTAEYGTAELIYTASDLIMPITSLVIYEAVLRYSLDRSVDRTSVILNAGVIFVGGSVLALLIAPLVGLYPALNEWKWYVSLNIISYMAAELTMIYIRAKEKTKLFVFLGLGQTLILALLNIVLLVFCHLGIYGYVMANILAQTAISVTALFAGGILSDLKRAHFDRALFRQMLAYSSPLILNNISWWVIQSSDKFMVEFFVGASALGLYTAASKIPALINVITSIFSKAWDISSVKEYDSTKETAFYSNVFGLYSFVVFFVCACLLLIIKPFMLIYVGEQFRESWSFVPWLLVAASFSAISAYFGALYSALKKSVNVMLSTLLSATINFVLNLLLIPRMGVLGAVAATAIAYVFIAFFRMFDSRRYLSFPIDFGKTLLSYAAVCVSAFFVTADRFAVPVAAAAILTVLAANREQMKKLISAGLGVLHRK